MSFDALTLAAVRDELEPLLVDARIQRLVFPDELSLAIEFYAPQRGRSNVLLSAHLEHSRIQRIRQLKLPARGLERDSPFSLLIRKHLRDARVRTIHQPRLERLFELDCEQRDASSGVYKVKLIVEAMGRRSNLMLVDEHGTILDAARRTPPSRSRRPVLPHLRYVPPPSQDRLLPEDITADTLARGAAEDVDLSRHLAQRVAGLSPLAARELAFRASDAPLNWEHVAAVAREFLGVLATHDWQPCVAFEGERALDYAPYVLTHLVAAGARLEQYASPSEAMDAFYTEPRSARRGDPLGAERKALFAPIERALHATQRRIAGLTLQLETGQSQREPLRRAGEAILSHQAELPVGASELVAGGERFELDPRLGAVENAQAYFARYRKAREAEERVPGLLESARNSAEYLEELRTLVELADNMDAIRALRSEVAAATRTSGIPDRKASQSAKSAPYRRFPLSDGCEALVGTSALGNASVTFELGRANDLWLHARGVHGAHVILRCPGHSPPDSVLERAASLAAYHSAARNSAGVEVDIAPRRYVKKVPNGPPGLVRYTHERTVRVTPRHA